MSAALRRVTANLPLLLGLALGQIALAALAGRATRSLLLSALAPFTLPDDGHMLAYLAQLATTSPAAMAGMSQAVLTATLLGALLALAAAGGTFARLAGTEPFLTASARHLPPLAVQSAYHLFFRALLVLFAFLAVVPISAPLGALLMVLLWAASSHVLDRTRAGVVLGDARWHPRPALRAFRAALADPRTLAGATALALAQLALPVAALALLLAAGAGPGAPWLARASAFVAVFLGLWRIALICRPTQTGAP